MAEHGLYSFNLTDSWGFSHDAFFHLWFVLVFLRDLSFSFSFVISSLDAFLLLLGPDLGFDKFRDQVGFCVPSTLPCFLTLFSDSGHENPYPVAP